MVESPFSLNGSYSWVIQEICMGFTSDFNLPILCKRGLLLGSPPCSHEKDEVGP